MNCYCSTLYFFCSLPGNIFKIAVVGVWCSILMLLAKTTFVVTIRPAVNCFTILVSLSDWGMIVPEMVPSLTLGYEFGCFEVDTSRTTRVNSSSWWVRGAKNTLICSLTASCVNVWNSKFSPSTFSDELLFAISSVLLWWLILHLVAFSVSNFCVVGGMKHWRFKTWTIPLFSLFVWFHKNNDISANFAILLMKCDEI